MNADMREVRLPTARVDLVTREVHRPGAATTRLTAQEARLLARLAATPDEPVSRQTLLADVWDYHPDSTSRAPDVAVRRLRTKIEDDPSEPVHLCTVLSHGWVLRGARTDRAPRRVTPPDLVGREALLDAVHAALATGRGVCLVGPPGVGKTELARTVAAGAVHVPLEGARDERALLAAVARALRLPAAGVTSLGEHVGTVLEGRDRLVWLDAPEAVVEPVARWVARWPARFVVSSRVAVPGLHAVDVPPLSRADARALFARLAPDVDPDPRILDALDGLPLAVRLAAARARQLGADALIGEHGLRYERVVAPGTAVGLAQGIARSWDLLDPVARGVMVALSPLVDGFDLATAEAIAPVPDGWVGDVLVDLVQRSLLVREPGPRYRMLQSVRWFAARQGEPPVDRLVDWAKAARGTLTTLRGVVDLAAARRPERVAELVLALDDALAEQLSTYDRRALLEHATGLPVRHRLAWIAWRLGEHGALDRLEAIRREADGTPLADRVLVELAGARRAVAVPTDDEVDALRTVLARTADPELRIATLRELAEQHTDRREFREARVALQQAMAVDRDDRRRVELLCAVGHVALKQDRPLDGLDAVEEAARRVPAGALGERAWRTLGGLRYLSGDLEGAAAAWEHARELARELGLWRQYAVSLGNLGLVYADLGDTREARRAIEEALARSQELDQPLSVVPNLLNLGKVALLEGAVAEGRALLTQAVALARARGWTQHAVQGRVALAVAVQLDGHDAREALEGARAEALEVGADREAALAAAHLALPDAPDRAVGEGPSDRRLLEAARRVVAGRPSPEQAAPGDRPVPPDPAGAPGSLAQPHRRVPEVPETPR